MNAKFRFRTAASAAVLAFVALSARPAAAQFSPDMVSRKALRVCADPSNPPFSDKKLDGFENKIATIVASQLKEPLRYFWAPSGPGFVRNTLNSDLCDVIMGYTIGSEMVQSTNPYYRSTYVIVAPKGSPLNGIEGLDDPKLKDHTLGVFAATPPVDVLVKNHMIDRAKVYALIVDHRFTSPLDEVLADLKDKKIDAAIVWGPLIGDSVKHSDGALVMTPLLKDVDKPDFAYRISFGVRHDELDWKHKLKAVTRARHGDIDKVLVDYNVPLIDNAGHLIPPDKAVANEAATMIAPAVPSEHHGRAPAPSAGFKMPGPAPVNAPTAGK